jgi:hypothetical protein
MSRLTKWLLAANLVAITLLVFAWPQLMVSPGPLIAGHRSLEKDCFACHAALRGSVAERCTRCHAVADIGRVTTAGAPLVSGAATGAVGFHQQLVGQDCTACHSDHAGVIRYRKLRRFDHGLLSASARSRCESCHRPPQDTLHRGVGTGCAQCHAVGAWRPASFDHQRWFVLDAAHNASCATCHVGGNFKRYTCYGCHEHTVAGIRSAHVEEGITQFANCVQCHRSAREAGEGRDGGGGDD